MSHFSVLVVGEDVKYQLAPFHEFECTGRDDEFIKDVDITQEVLDDMKKEQKTLDEALDYHGLSKRTVESESQLNRADAHKYGYAIVRGDTLVKAVDRTNPNKKYDYWTVGGRWSDMLLTKAGQKCNQALKSEVDFAGMRAAEAAEAESTWRKVHAVIDAFPSIVDWHFVRENRFPNDDEAARKFYWEQPGLKALEVWNRSNGHPLGALIECDDLLLPLDRYMKAKADAAISCFAFLRDRQWAERGQMGWWACVSNEKDQETWNAMFNRLLADVPDSERLTVVDCHI